MTSTSQRRVTSRKVILTAFGILFVGLLLLLFGGDHLPEWAINLMVPGIPTVFIALMVVGFWLQVDTRKHG